MTFRVFQHHADIYRIPAQSFFQNIRCIPVSAKLKKKASIFVIESAVGNRDRLEIQFAVRQLTVKKLFKQLVEIIILRVTVILIIKLLSKLY